MNAPSDLTTNRMRRIVLTGGVGAALLLGLGVLAGCPVEETPRREPTPPPAEPAPAPGTQPGTEPGTQPGAQPRDPADPYGG